MFETTPFSKANRIYKAFCHKAEGNKIHPNTRNNKAEILNQTTFINSWKQDDDDAN
jgi:hypothetical protein